MQTESRRPLPRSTASRERISESTSTSTPKRYENKFRNHYCYAITICFWLWSKSSKAACELALTTMDWFLSLHHQEMPPRLLWIIEYLYPNHYVNILPRRNNSRKQKASREVFRNVTLSETLSTHGRRAHGKMPPCTAGSMLMGVHTLGEDAGLEPARTGFHAGVNNN